MEIEGILVGCMVGVKFGWMVGDFVVSKVGMFVDNVGIAVGTKVGVMLG